MIWGIQWIWGTYTVRLQLFSDWGIQRRLVRLDCHGLQSNLSLSILHVHLADLRNQYCTASFMQWPRKPVNLRNLYCTDLFIQWSGEAVESEESILFCFIDSVIWWIQWIWGTYIVLLHVFRDLRNAVNMRNLYCTALFIQSSEESSESEEPILNSFIYLVI